MAVNLIIKLIMNLSRCEFIRGPVRATSIRLGISSVFLLLLFSLIPPSADLCHFV